MLIFWLGRGKFLLSITKLFSYAREMMEDVLFYLTYSLETEVHELYLQKWCYQMYQFLLSLLFTSFLLKHLGLGRRILVPLSFLFLLLLIALLLGKLQEGKSRLIRELGNFVFYYELFLMQGENQLQALNRARKELGFLSLEESVEDYMLQFNRLFYHSKWLVVKRFVILLDKGMHFTQRDMSLEFAQLSDELFNRHHQDRKLQAEKIENLMLFPMIGDLLIMVLYLLSPFIGEMLGG